MMRVGVGWRGNENQVKEENGGGMLRQAPVKETIGSTACVFWTLWAEGKEKGRKKRQSCSRALLFWLLIFHTRRCLVACLASASAYFCTSAASALGCVAATCLARCARAREHFNLQY